MNMRPTLFYSWQSDDLKTKAYIERALKKALENVANYMNLEDAPRLDKDTQDEVGAVSITSIIKQKINRSKIFLADISLVNKNQIGEKLANQNVMFELGYAFGKKSERAVILVANSDLGSANELPFDIAQNRVMFFSPKKDLKSIKFISNLEGAIKAHLGLIQEEETTIEQEDSKEKLITAIEDGKPTQTKSEKFFENIFARYLELAPEPSEGDKNVIDYGEKIFNAYQKTLPVTIELFEVINFAAEYSDIKSINIAYRMLGRIATRYEKHNSDEYAALLIQEIASIIIGCLAKYEHWNDIGALIDTEFAKPSGGIRKYKIEDTYQYPNRIKQFYNNKTGMNYAIPTTPMIQERFVDNDKILQAYITGSLILMFALRFYYSYLSGKLLSEDEYYVPQFISSLKFKSYAEKFKFALGLNSLDELRHRLEEKRQQPLSDGLAYWNRDLTHIFKSENLLPINEKVGEK